MWNPYQSRHVILLQITHQVWCLPRQNTNDSPLPFSLQYNFLYSIGQFCDTGCIAWYWKIYTTIADEKTKKYSSSQSMTIPFASFLHPQSQQNNQPQPWPSNWQCSRQHVQDANQIIPYQVTSAFMLEPQPCVWTQAINLDYFTTFPGLARDTCNYKGKPFAAQVNPSWSKIQNISWQHWITPLVPTPEQTFLPSKLFQALNLLVKYEQTKMEVPVPSNCWNQYLMVAYICDANTILALPQNVYLWNTYHHRPQTNPPNLRQWMSYKKPQTTWDTGKPGT